MVGVGEGRASLHMERPSRSARAARKCQSSRTIAALSFSLVGVGACQDPISPHDPGNPYATEALTVDASYNATNLGTLPGGGDSFGEDINVHGHVAGIATDSAGNSHAVVWIGTTLTDLGVPFGTRSAAFGINDSQAVVGHSTDGISRYGVIWKNGGHTLFSGASSPHMVDAMAINNSDVVTGYHLAGGTSIHAYRYSAGGGFVDIHPSSYAQSVGLGVNDAGVIVGYVQLADGSTHAAQWNSANTFYDLGTLGGLIGRAEAVNASGTIVGESAEANGRLSPFSWRSATGMVGSGLGGYALDLSNAGRAVGYKPLPNRHAAATGKNVANVLTLPSLSAGTNSYAIGVNTCGHIAGIAGIAGGAYRAVRWTILTCD